MGWKDDDGSVGNEDHKRNTGGKADKTTPEYGTGPKTTETPKHPQEVKDPKIKISTEPSKKEDPKRVEQRKNARILALAIAVALVVLEIWTAKIDGTELDLEYIRNRILVAAIPFISCGILFYGKSFDLAFWASIVLGFFALYDVFVFAFYTMLSLNGEVSDLGMGIVIVIGIIIWIWAGKTVYWSIDEKNMKVK